MHRLVDTREDYQTPTDCEVSSWEKRLICRLRQLMRGCQKAEFIIRIDGDTILLQRVNCKIETIK